MARRPTWKQNADGGYTHTSGHRLTKVGKTWVLATRAGQRFDLGRKASFTSAERVLTTGTSRGAKALAPNRVKLARKVRTRSNYIRNTPYAFTRRGIAQARTG